MCVGLLPEGQAFGSGRHNWVKRQVDRGNRITILSNSSSHSYVSSGHDLSARENGKILAWGKKTTRHWPKKEMLKSYECFNPVYQTESSAFPNRTHSFHAPFFLYHMHREKNWRYSRRINNIFHYRKNLFSCSYLHPVTCVCIGSSYVSPHDVAILLSRVWEISDRSQVLFWYSIIH